MESTGVRTIDHMEVEYEDLDVGQEADVSIAKDGGCMKKVLAKGSGDERPQIGNEVTVHYTGTLLDGTKFDSSVDRGDPFKFKLGVGQVIKGWDEGVASMRKGEKAILTCTPEYAYGAAGSPPTIPANSTLKFEVELFSWTNDNDLYKDAGIVLAKTLKKADGYTFAKERDEVKVTYSSRRRTRTSSAAATRSFRPRRRSLWSRTRRSTACALCSRRLRRATPGFTR